MSDDIVNEKFSTLEKIKEWWNANVEYTDNNDDKIISTELWNKFKKENKEYVGENNLNIEQFKDAITGNVVKTSNYIEKTKKGAIEFIGFKWKDVEVKYTNILELNNLVVENITTNKIKKQKKIEFYFDKETDKKILLDYENENNTIMTMCNDNMRPWQIVSLLMRYKIINKRDEARGYDLYKETEEYKSKLNSK
jgi:hypothetical protein